MILLADGGPTPASTAFIAPKSAQFIGISDIGLYRLATTPRGGVFYRVLPVVAAAPRTAAKFLVRRCLLDPVLTDKATPSIKGVVTTSTAESCTKNLGWLFQFSAAVWIATVMPNFI